MLLYTHTHAHTHTNTHSGNDLAEMPKGTWVGVVYDEPVGKNDGTVKGRRLFQCKKNHGHLLRPEKVNDVSCVPQDINTFLYKRI